MDRAAAAALGELCSCSPGCMELSPAEMKGKALAGDPMPTLTPQHVLCYVLSASDPCLTPQQFHWEGMYIDSAALHN